MAGSGNSPVGGSSKGILERTSIPFPPHQPLPALCPKGKRALPSPLKACPKGGAWGGACGHRNFEPAPPQMHPVGIEIQLQSKTMVQNIMSKSINRSLLFSNCNILCYKYDFLRCRIFPKNFIRYYVGGDAYEI